MHNIFWIGLIVTLPGTVAYLFKLCVVRDVSRDAFNGGGVPTLDLPVIYPILMTLGTSAMLHSLGVTPFPYFGFVLWFTIVLMTIGLMWLFDRLGKPIRDAQLRSIEARDHIARDTTTDRSAGRGTRSEMAEGE